MTYLDPKKIGKTKINLETIFPSPNAKHVVIEKEKLERNLKYFLTRILKMY
jgi:hypothetical protein